MINARLVPWIGGLFIIVALATSPTTAAAARYDVRSIAELQARLDQAAPGDSIVLRDGAYATSAAIRVARAGRAGAPIVITAQRLLGVTITGTHGFDVSAPASYVEIIGFTFTHASGTTAIGPGATYVRFAHNVFECTGPGAYLTTAGDYTEVDHNEFRNKKTVGNMLDVRGQGSQVAQHVRIHHNYFHDFEPTRANGAETIRLGLSGLSMSKGFAIIEHNLFVRCIGENELMSIKSGSNEIRYNTLLDSPGAQLTLRHGNENRVHGNYLRRTDGIRVFGDRNWVFGNHLEENTGALNIGNGGGEVADGAPLTSHDRPDETIIAFNSLVNNARNFYMTARPSGMGATGTTFANNVIVGGGPAATIDGPYSGGVWRDNVIWKTAGPGAMPAGAFTERDAQVVPLSPLAAGEMLRAIRSGR